jgi:hypothetical protein
MLIGGVILTLAGAMASYIVMRTTVEGVAVKVDKNEDAIAANARITADAIGALDRRLTRMEASLEFGRKTVEVDVPAPRLFSSTRPIPGRDSLDIAGAQGLAARVFGLW